MARFTVGSSIPDAVQDSIDSGVFERVGGVIREVLGRMPSSSSSDPTSCSS